MGWGGGALEPCKDRMGCNLQHTEDFGFTWSLPGGEFYVDFGVFEYILELM